MSAGDIDNVLASEGELDWLRLHHPDLNAYLTMAWSLKPIRTFFIPAGAGISDSGKRVYISYDIQTIVDGIECESCLVRHETTEWGLRLFAGIGYDYFLDPRGHRLGNRAECDCALHLLGRDDAWEIYSEIIDPQVVIDERMEFDEKPVPRDLALYPYEDEQREALQMAMWNKRSEEEWSRLNGR